MPFVLSDTGNKDRDPLFDAVDAVLVQGNGHPHLGHAIWQIRPHPGDQRGLRDFGRRLGYVR